MDRAPTTYRAVRDRVRPILPGRWVINRVPGPCRHPAMSNPGTLPEVLPWDPTRRQPPNRVPSPGPSRNPAMSNPGTLLEVHPWGPTRPQPPGPVDKSRRVSRASHRPVPGTLHPNRVQAPLGVRAHPRAIALAPLRDRWRNISESTIRPGAWASGRPDSASCQRTISVIFQVTPSRWRRM